jgi:hypothetical protein
MTSGCRASRKCRTVCRYRSQWHCRNRVCRYSTSRHRRRWHEPSAPYFVGCCAKCEGSVYANTARPCWSDANSCLDDRSWQGVVVWCTREFCADGPATANNTQAMSISSWSLLTCRGTALLPSANGAADWMPRWKLLAARKTDVNAGFAADRWVINAAT